MLKVNRSDLRSIDRPYCQERKLPPQHGISLSIRELLISLGFTHLTVAKSIVNPKKNISLQFVNFES